MPFYLANTTEIRGYSHIVALWPLVSRVMNKYHISGVLQIGPDVCQYLFVQTSIDNMSREWTKHLNDPRSQRTKVKFSFEVIHGPGNFMAIGRTVVYHARSACAFSAGIKYRHCMHPAWSSKCLDVQQVSKGARWNYIALWNEYDKLCIGTFYAFFSKCTGWLVFLSWLLCGVRSGHSTSRMM